MIRVLVAEDSVTFRLMLVGAGQPSDGTYTKIQCRMDRDMRNATRVRLMGYSWRWISPKNKSTLMGAMVDIPWIASMPYNSATLPLNGQNVNSHEIFLPVPRGPDAWEVQLHCATGDEMTGGGVSVRAITSGEVASRAGETHLGYMGDDTTANAAYEAHLSTAQSAVMQEATAANLSNTKLLVSEHMSGSCFEDALGPDNWALGWKLIFDYPHTLPATKTQEINRIWTITRNLGKAGTERPCFSIQSGSTNMPDPLTIVNHSKATIWDPRDALSQNLTGYQAVNWPFAVVDGGVQNSFEVTVKLRQFNPTIMCNAGGSGGGYDAGVFTGTMTADYSTGAGIVDANLCNTDVMVLFFEVDNAE